MQKEMKRIMHFVDVLPKNVQKLLARRFYEVLQEVATELHEKSEKRQMEKALRNGKGNVVALRSKKRGEKCR
jgi:hypothetical protein